MSSAPLVARQHDYSRTAAMGEASAVAGSQWMRSRRKQSSSTLMRSHNEGVAHFGMTAGSRHAVASAPALPCSEMFVVAPGQTAGSDWTPVTHLTGSCLAS